jgi:NAD(P)-dependent dehydrogenase (short-subunit alcohol dehydrogenase family)
MQSITINTEITTELLLHGIKKVIIIARSEDRYITAREEWRHREGISLENDTRAVFVKCDLGDIQDVKAAVDMIKQVTDRLHILVCNAGELYLSISTESLHINLPP